MSDAHRENRTWKQKVAHEFLEYWITFAYLACLFVVFAWHRRFILDEANIPVNDYWTPLIEAAVLAKVVLIIDLFGTAHRFESKPLILTTLYKTGLFAVGILIFNVLEATVRGLIQHHHLMHGLHEFTRMNRFELCARMLEKCFSLIPFFAFREVSRVLGEGTLTMLFFTSRRPKLVELRPEEQAAKSELDRPGNGGI
ncbi:MAG: hypothetical protein U0573_10245 [Phycisphaerales bacterium]|nr:hypothetical protein [Planctomycetota bacterium]